MILLEKLPISSTFEKYEKRSLSTISQGHVSWFTEFSKRGFTFPLLPGCGRWTWACRTGLCCGSLLPLLKLRCSLKFSLHRSRGMCICSQGQTGWGWWPFQDHPPCGPHAVFPVTTKVIMEMGWPCEEGCLLPTEGESGRRRFGLRADWPRPLSLCSGLSVKRVLVSALALPSRT